MAWRTGAWRYSIVIASDLFASVVALGAQVSEAPTPATVEQPRAFGYVIGDLVRQRVLLPAGASQIERVALPDTHRVNVWLEWRTARIEQSPDGSRWLVVEYQVVNAPQSLTTVTMPQWELESPDAKLTIPAWGISVGPLSPRAPYTLEGMGELRPDRAAPIAPADPIRRRLIRWSLALTAVLVAWFGWAQQRNWRESQSLPFACAWRQVRRRGERDPRAWQALHRAFDATAGRVIQSENVPALFRRAPHLEPLRSGIERFFAESSERFFGAAAPQERVSVRALCRELRRLEKRSAL